jgi:translation initiation factor 3 subunit I
MVWLKRVSEIFPCEMRPIQLHGHERPLTQIKYNREGDLLFSAARDKSPNVWFSHNGERLGSFDGHNGTIYSLDPSYDSRRLLTAGADNYAKLWDVEEGKCLYSHEFKTPVRWVEYALGEREALILTDARMKNPGLLNIFSVTPQGFGEVPMQSIVMPGARATIALWGHLNKYILTGHEDGTIMKWDPKVRLF